MDISSQQFFGWSVVDWAQILGGIVACGAIMAGIVRVFRYPPLSSKKNKGSTLARNDQIHVQGATQNPSNNLDKALDRLTVVAVVAPAVPSIANTVGEIIKDRFSEHALDAIAAKTSVTAELVAGDLAAHAVDAASVAGDITGHVATNHADTAHDVIKEAISNLLG